MRWTGIRAFLRLLHQRLLLLLLQGLHLLLWQRLGLLLQQRLLMLQQGALRLHRLLQHGLLGNSSHSIGLLNWRLLNWRLLNWRLLNWRLLKWRLLSWRLPNWRLLTVLPLLLHGVLLLQDSLLGHGMLDLGLPHQLLHLLLGEGMLKSHVRHGVHRLLWCGPQMLRHRWPLTLPWLQGQRP